MTYITESLPAHSTKLMVAFMRLSSLIYSCTALMRSAYEYMDHLLRSPTFYAHFPHQQMNFDPCVLTSVIQQNELCAIRARRAIQDVDGSADRRSVSALAARRDKPVRASARFHHIRQRK